MYKENLIFILCGNETHLIYFYFPMYLIFIYGMYPPRYFVKLINIKILKERKREISKYI